MDVMYTTLYNEATRIVTTVGSCARPTSSKKVVKKKSEMKTKKVATVIFLGELFFMLLFGGLVPSLKVRYGGMREPFMSGDSCEWIFW